MEVGLVLHFLPQSDPLRLPGENNQTISFILRLCDTSYTGGVLEVALVQFYLLHDENTELVSRQDVELVTGVTGDVLGLLVVHQHSGEHGAHILQPLVKLALQRPGVNPATQLVRKSKKGRAYSWCWLT